MALPDFFFLLFFFVQQTTSGIGYREIKYFFRLATDTLNVRNNNNFIPIMGVGKRGAY